jgi:hypothetical protein
MFEDLRWRGPRDAACDAFSRIIREPASDRAPARERPIAACVAGERDAFSRIIREPASDRAPARERPIAACVAGERG